MQVLPEKLYSVDSVVRLEQIAIQQYSIPAYTLMKRAGKAVFDVIQKNYSQHENILVLCGAGNNAGDGYVVATLAKQAGYPVRIVSLIDPVRLKNEALQAYSDWQQLETGNDADLTDAYKTDADKADLSLIDKADLIVDALLGTGLRREVSSEWAEWINTVNQANKPVIAVDIPSGLVADTGVVAGSAIKADITVCFIGLKQGMFTAQAKDVCGDIVFDDLGLTDDIYSQVEADADLLTSVDYSLLPERKQASNKGSFGHVLIVGGNKSMPGAIILAARSALRTGAGLVTIVTVAENLTAICSAVPEAMIKTCSSEDIAGVLPDAFVAGITHIAIGMGLGQDEWSLALLQYCVRLNKPMLIDADGLNLIANEDITITSPLVITPHPGEAARLLSTATTVVSSGDIQQDRFDAIRKLYQLFSESESCVVVLKGSGSLIFDGDDMNVCSLGNAAMAAPGMGDVLSGIIIALMAQGIKPGDAAELGVCLHASAASSFTENKTRGLLASDVIDELTEVLQ
ncbi:MAG: NAD(P)H-hydrate dehydratase [Proteobacteria bacterium]|nr:NAD(P)H-hydrate dehydratase [Pseudomonadota bacterium]